MTKFYVEATSGANKSDDSVRRVGEFDTREEAIACAKRVIDAFLIAQYQWGMYPNELLARYLGAGDQPAIFQDDDATMNVSGFNPLQYARQRCQDYCGKKDAS